MSYGLIRTALISRMAVFDGIEQERIDYPNQKDVFTPPNTGLWCRPNIQYGEAFMAGMADKPYTRRPGRFVVQCFAREGEGLIGLSKLADDLIEHFSYYTSGNFECLEGAVADIGRNNGFYQYNVIIRFRAG